MSPDTASSRFVTAPDGLRLHVREWGLRTAGAGGTLPVVCLPGLARTVADFEALAAALASSSNSDRDGPGLSRWVMALDSRGRGKSEYDPTPGNYNLRTELWDLVAVLTALEVHRAVFVGTSRGGILSMLLAAARPTVIAGCVLNDIGPVIETEGLARIRGYVGKLPFPASLRDAADILRRLFETQFPKLADEEWLAFARRTFRQSEKGIVPDYDPRLALIMKELDPARPLDPMWEQFDALAPVPVMVIRGDNSDILSLTTVQAMRARRTHLEVVEVPNQGHAPLLTDSPTISRILEFVARCEGQAHQSSWM
jgi:pimeloyl-ACP methyl ester carboxylesterase